MWKTALIVIALVLSISALAYGLGWIGEGAQVAQEEFGPNAALEKYEWFIDQENRIQKMDQDIEIFQNRVAGVETQYAGSYGSDKTKWAPHIQLQYNRENQMARDDLVAVVSQRNNLVREYNAASEKFSWAPFRSWPDIPQEKYAEYGLR